MQTVEDVIAAEAAIGRMAPIGRYPQLMAAPVIMAAVWNGLWAGGAPLNPAGMFSSFLDLVFGPATPPTRSPDAGT